MSKLPKKGTIWLLTRIKEGHTLSAEEANEIMDYIGQLETSNNDAHNLLSRLCSEILESILGNQAYRNISEQIGNLLPATFDKPSPPKNWKIECDSDGCYIDLRIHRSLNEELAKLAHHNKILIGDILRQACLFVANYPGVVGLTSIPPQKSEQEG